ncbi:Fur family transcriptional regulator [Membranihabitans marinus]|uniref:Fur family transcriptional regulator n=1 Tax=Membranihabitans marinus TaxID=1227546 RepID=UPI001F0076D2|nr:transcriptional repressor [Membranihabitans marinus]
MNEIESKLEARKIRPTAMRILVLQYLTQQDTAVSLKSLELAFEKADTSTLFRTLKTFEDHKLVHRIEDGSGQTKYALCLQHCQCRPQDQHYHFHCIQCEETYCLTANTVPQLDLPANFTLKQANLVLKGICAHCQL